MKPAEMSIETGNISATSSISHGSPRCCAFRSSSAKLGVLLRSLTRGDAGDMRRSLASALRTICLSDNPWVVAADCRIAREMDAASIRPEIFGGSGSGGVAVMAGFGGATLSARYVSGEDGRGCRPLPLTGLCRPMSAPRRRDPRRSCLLNAEWTRALPFTIVCSNPAFPGSPLTERSAE